MTRVAAMPRSFSIRTAEERKNGDQKAISCPLSLVRRAPRASARDRAAGQRTPLKATERRCLTLSPCFASTARRSADCPAKPIRLNAQNTSHPGPALGRAVASAFAPSSPMSTPAKSTASRGGMQPLASAVAISATPASPKGLKAIRRAERLGAMPRRKTLKISLTPRALKRHDAN